MAGSFADPDAAISVIFESGACSAPFIWTVKTYAVASNHAEELDQCHDPCAQY